MSPDAETAAAAAKTAAVAQESAERALVEIRSNLKKLQNLDGRLRRIEERLGMLEGVSPGDPIGLPLPDLKDLTDRVFALETRKPSREVVTTQVETLPQDYVDQIKLITRDLKTFKESQEFVLPRAFAELVDRVNAIEGRPVDITPATITTVVEERLAGHDSRIDALENHGEAAGELYEALAKLMRQVAHVMREVDGNRTRSDSQHKAVMDHMGHLAATILRAG